MLYADWANRDSLLVSGNEFKADLKRNYKKMKKYGVRKKDAPYFLPPYEWYNRQVVRWTTESGLTLVNFSPGTWSAADYTYPEMNDRYRSSEVIERSIIEYEATNSLNGFILLLHIGTDPRRIDKFYNRLDDLIDELQRRGYRFIRIDELLE